MSPKPVSPWLRAALYGVVLAVSISAGVLLGWLVEAYLL